MKYPISVWEQRQRHLSSLLNQKVNITTPTVEVSTWDELSVKYDRPCVMLQISYKEGIDGNNVLILKERDVKIITDFDDGWHRSG